MDEDHYEAISDEVLEVEEQNLQGKPQNNDDDQVIDEPVEDEYSNYGGEIDNKKPEAIMPKKMEKVK